MIVNKKFDKKKKQRKILKKGMVNEKLDMKKTRFGMLTSIKCNVV